MISRRLGIVLGSILAPFAPPKGLPFGTLLALKIDQKIDPKSDCSKSRSKIAPRPPKTLPRCPPEAPGEPQDPPRGFREPRSNQKIRNRREHVEKKKSTTVIHSGHSHRSSQTPKALSPRSEPRGWRRWSREALFNPPPLAQHGVLRLPREDLCKSEVFQIP